MSDRAIKLMQSTGLSEDSAFLIYNPSNMFYLSGYLGEGLLFISRKVCAVITDFRYAEQAQKEAPSFTVEMTQHPVTHEQIAARLCRENHISTVYYEPGFVTVETFEACKKEMPNVTFLDQAGAVEKLRRCKSEEEIALIQHACDITSDAFEHVLPYIKEGVTEKEIALQLDFDMMRMGASAPSFSTIVAAGAHGSLCHAVPGANKIHAGDMITMDFGARFGNYCADMTRTVALGKPSDEMLKIYQTVLEAQKMARDAVCAGKNCKAIDAIARDYINSKGYEGRFGHGLGHSVGIDIHEAPRFNQSCEEALLSGEIMTVEPGIYVPNLGGVRIEDSVVVRDHGCDVLTKPTRELIIL